MRRLALGIVLLLSGCIPNGLLESLAPPGPETPPAWFGPENQSQRIPGGATCVGWLAQLGIAHDTLPPQPGVDTPVTVAGPIANVRYASPGRGSLVADCRLILALDWMGAALQEQGVTAVLHSGAYAYRTQKSGRLSLHARGLAIDIHALDYGERREFVERDFARGLGDGCSRDAPDLNRLVCQLRRLGLFQELITPDHDADHHDHVHLAISPRDDHS
jgi:hypothetical protein